VPPQRAAAVEPLRKATVPESEAAAVAAVAAAVAVAAVAPAMVSERRTLYSVSFRSA
jgi:hypothetical protein